MKGTEVKTMVTITPAAAAKFREWIEEEDKGEARSIRLSAIGAG